jgi:hypothetical protein
MKISLSFQHKTITATLIDGETSRDFVSLLPLTLTMSDLSRREKFSRLPRAISERGKRQHTLRGRRLDLLVSRSRRGHLLSQRR